MEYMTVREAARKWKISERLTQQYCMDGRIEGARKFGGSWAIPVESRKPSDPRRLAAAASSKPACPLAVESAERQAAARSPMTLMNAAFMPGHCMEYVNGLEDVPLREMALAEYYYFSGRPEESVQISERYLSHPDLALRLSSCLLYAYANLSLGRIQRVRYTLAEVRNTLAASADMPLSLRASALFIVTAAAVLLHLPLLEEMNTFEDYIRFLPPGLRMFAIYVQAHHTYLKGDYGKSAGMVEAALTMQEEIFPIPTIYLHLVAVMDYMGLKQPEQAQLHLLAAWSLAQPDDLIEAFGEHHGLLGGMLEVTLKKDYPEDFKRIIAITYRFSAGWRKVHGAITGHVVADNLTTTEFATAMLASRGWTNQEIATHLGISTNTVKRYISMALQKLDITQRKDLKRYMLQ